MPNYDKVCKHCSKEYVAHHPKSLFCSESCRVTHGQKQQRLKLKALSEQGESALASSDEFKAITALLDQVAVLVADLKSKAV